jgi:hypothetical protein
VTPGELAGLTTLVDRGQLGKAAEEVRRLWSLKREPILAELLECFPKRKLPAPDGADWSRVRRFLDVSRGGDALSVADLVVEMEALLAEEEAAAVVPCLRALGARPGDPRIGAACVRWLLQPEQVLSRSVGMYRELEHALQHHLDPRQAATLATQARAGNPWAVYLGNFATARVLHTLASDAHGLAFQRQPIPPAIRERLDALAERVRKMPVEVAPNTVESVLMRIRREPADEGTRGVFRDLLLEANDPWGELIAVQEARAKFGGPRSAEETRLLAEVEPRILGTLPLRRPGMAQPLEYGRGFLTHAGIRGHAHEVGAVMEQPELSTLERVTFYDAAAITPNLVALKEAHGLTLADLERAAKKAPGVKLQVVSVKHATAPELALATWWPELKELYTFDPATRIDALLALPVAKQLTSVGLLDRPAATAFERFDSGTLALAPASIKRVRVDAFGLRGTLRVTWVRAEGGWRAEVSEGTLWLPVSDRAPGGDLERALPALKQFLRGARSVSVLSGVSPQLRKELEQR